EPVQVAGRVLADLGAAVTVVGSGYTDRLRAAAWGAGKTAADPAELAGLLAAADIMLVTPFEPGTPDADRSAAPDAVWVDGAPFRGKRSGGAIGRTREIWPCADGYVSFGLRGGKARIPNLELISRLVADVGIEGADVLTARDWSAYNHNTATDEELRAIEAPI